MSQYIEYPKPNSLADIDFKLYYMYSNRHDVLGESYQEITNDEALELVYKVYVKQ